MMETTNNEALFRADDLVFVPYTRPWVILYQYLEFWVLLLASFQVVAWVGTIFAVGLLPILAHVLPSRLVGVGAVVVLCLYAVLSMMAATVFDAAVVYRTAAHYAGDKPDWKTCARPGMRKIALLLLPCFFLHMGRFVRPTMDMMDVVISLQNVGGTAAPNTTASAVSSDTAPPAPATAATETLVPMGVIDSATFLENAEEFSSSSHNINATSNETMAVFPASINLPTTGRRTLKRGTGVSSGGFPQQGDMDESPPKTQHGGVHNAPQQQQQQGEEAFLPNTPAKRRLYNFARVIADLEWLFVHVGIFVIPIILVERKGLVAAFRRSLSLSLKQWNIVFSAQLALWLLDRYSVPFLVRRVGLPVFVVSRLTWPLELIIVTVTYFAARVCEEGLTGSDFMEEWYTHVLHEEGGTTNDAFINVGVPTSNDDIYIMQKTKEEKESEATASETTETHESVAENTNEEKTEESMNGYHREISKDSSERSVSDEELSETLVAAADEPVLLDSQEETIPTAKPRRKIRDKRQKIHQVPGLTPAAQAENLGEETEEAESVEME